MPKSTPRPTNRTANAIESRLSEPTIINPTAVVIDRPMNRLMNTAKMILVECSAIQRITSTTSTVPMPLTTAPSCNGREFLVGDRNRSGQPDARADICRRRSSSFAACRIASVASLPGSSALKSRIGLNSMKARWSASVSGLSLTSSRQEKVAVPVFEHVLDGLGDLRERPLGAVELDLAALDAGKPGFQRAGQSANAGIAGHDFDQRRRGGKLAGQLARPPPREGTTARSFQRIRRSRAAERIEIAWYRRTVSARARQLAALVSSGVGASTTARMVLSRSNALSN